MKDEEVDKPIIKIMKRPSKPQGPYRIKDDWVQVRIGSFATLQQLVDWAAQHNNDLNRANILVRSVYDSETDCDIDELFLSVPRDNGRYLSDLAAYNKKMAEYKEWAEENADLVKKEKERRGMVARQRKIEKERLSIEREERKIEERKARLLEKTIVETKKNEDFRNEEAHSRRVVTQIGVPISKDFFNDGDSL